MTVGNPRIVFFVPEWVSSSPILHSQVLTVASFLQSKSADVIFVGADSPDVSSAKVVSDIQGKYGIKAIINNEMSSSSGFFGLRRACKAAYSLCSNDVVDFKPTHIYTRSIVASPFARRLASNTRAKLVYDVRAIASKEIMYKSRRTIASTLLELYEYHQIENSDKISCVSARLREYLMSKIPNKDIVVVPACVDVTRFAFNQQSRNEIRSRYGIADNEKVICYSGGMSKWQCLPEILNVFRMLSACSSRYRFLLLTPEVEALSRAVNECGFSAWVVKASPHEVPMYLSASDAGIVYREDTFINNISSPIKIAEYLACSLPVFATDGIGDYSDIIKREGVGLLLPRNNESVQLIRDFFDSEDFYRTRARASSVAIKLLSLDGNFKEYQRLYDWEEFIND